MLYIRGLLLIILTTIASVCHLQAKATAEVVDGNGKEAVNYDGIDVSSWQKDIDWTTTATDKNIKFVYIKATEGASNQSRHYQINIENARKQGLKVGSYHFMRTTSSIQKQFENFISIVKPEEQDLVPLLDVETKAGWTNEQLQDSVKLFVQLLEKYYGCKPMIYTGSNFFNNYLGTSFDNYPLFIARYSKTRPVLERGVEWVLWQFSDRGRIQGIDAYVDLCRFNKNYSVNDILMRRPAVAKRKVTTTEPKVVPKPKPRTEVQPTKNVPVRKKPKKANNKRVPTKQTQLKDNDKAEAEKKTQQQQADKAREQAKQQKELQEKQLKQQREQAKRQKELQEKQLKQQREQAKRQKELQEKQLKQQREQAERQKELQEKQLKQQREQAKQQKELQEKQLKQQREQAERQKELQEKQQREQAEQNKSKVAGNLSAEQLKALQKQRQQKLKNKTVNQSSTDNE